MSKYVFINVQGIHDVSTKVFNSYEELESYVEGFCEDDVDDDGNLISDCILPYGEANLDYQTLKVIKID